MKFCLKFHRVHEQMVDAIFARESENTVIQDSMKQGNGFLKCYSKSDTSA